VIDVSAKLLVPSEVVGLHTTLVVDRSWGRSATRVPGWHLRRAGSDAGETQGAQGGCSLRPPRHTSHRLGTHALEAQGQLHNAHSHARDGADLLPPSRWKHPLSPSLSLHISSAASAAHAARPAPLSWWRAHGSRWRDRLRTRTWPLLPGRGAAQGRNPSAVLQPPGLATGRSRAKTQHVICDVRMQPAGDPRSRRPRTANLLRGSDRSN
jgi:hypothetical protein